MGDVLYTDFKAKTGHYTRGPGGIDDLTNITDSIRRAGREAADAAPFYIPDTAPSEMPFWAPEEDPA